MIQLSFKQTRTEMMLRTAATLLFTVLERHNVLRVPLSSLINGVQYGYTASASATPVGPRFVRITDLKDGRIHWENVPFCECPDAGPYALHVNDILFARTGATTGKTHLISQLPEEPAVFASYLIRVRPNHRVIPGYLAAFFLSEQYWTQIVNQKEGSAQPNVNGDKLSRLSVPIADEAIQGSISRFMDAAARKYSDQPCDLPELLHPLTEQRRLVERIDALAAKIEEAKGLRILVGKEMSLLTFAPFRILPIPDTDHTVATLGDYIESHDSGWSPQCEDTSAAAGNWGVLKTTCVQWHGFQEHQNKALMPGMSPRPDISVVKDDVLITRAGPVNRVGVACRVPDSYPHLMLSDKIVRLRTKPSLLPDYLVAYFACPFAQEYFRQGKTGLAESQVNISREKLMRLPILVPSIIEQNQLLQWISATRQKLISVASLQDTLAPEIDALQPAILDRAFRGQL
jgi:type I restriction enzyme S subunit